MNRKQLFEKRTIVELEGIRVDKVFWYNIRPQTKGFVVLGRTNHAKTWHETYSSAEAAMERMQRDAPAQALRHRICKLISTRKEFSDADKSNFTQSHTITGRYTGKRLVRKPIR